MSLSVGIAALNHPTTSLAEWAQAVNVLAVQSREGSTASAGGTRAAAVSVSKRLPPTPKPGRMPLLTRAARLVGGARVGDGSDKGSNFADPSYRMTPTVAEDLVAAGLNPGYLNDLAAASGLDPRDLFEFAGIDRSTVSRRLASGAMLPHDAAVKALQATELVTQATEVFGTPAVASAWLSRAHPLLDGHTPLRRARTPWGMGKVQSMLVALRFGSAA